jgi:hypothetical protein
MTDFGPYVIANLLAGGCNVSTQDSSQMIMPEQFWNSYAVNHASVPLPSS